MKGLLFRHTFRLKLILGLALPLTLAGGDFRILALGDSLTAGYGLDPDYAFPALLEAKAREAGFAVTVRNAGLSGETSAGGLRRLDWVLRQPVDILILSLGANDALRGIDPSSTKENLERMILLARERHPDIRIVLGGMLAPPNMGPEYAEAFNSLYPELARSHDLHLVPFLLEDVAGIPRLNLPDGIHPNPEGHRIIARNVWPILESALPPP